MTILFIRFFFLTTLEPEIIQNQALQCDLDNWERDIREFSNSDVMFPGHSVYSVPVWRNTELRPFDLMSVCSALE